MVPPTLEDARSGGLAGHKIRAQFLLAARYT